MKWLKHAFAVEPEGPVEPTPEQKGVVDRVCREIVRRHLTTPALAFLEMARPLNYLGAQALHFFTPLLAALTDAEGARRFAAFLERRGSVDYLCRRIEELEAEAVRRERGLSESSPHGDEKPPNGQARQPSGSSATTSAPLAGDESPPENRAEN